MNQRGALLGILLLCIAAPGAGQVTAGALMGSVTDQTGQPLARAEVRVDDQLHRVRRTAFTDETGLYRLVDLPPASYAVTASATGFGQVARDDVGVPVGSTV